MARRNSLQEDVEEIAALRQVHDDDELRERLRHALGDRRPLIAGKAARVAADRGLAELVPEIASALDRLLGPEEDDDAQPQDDPGCLGKTGLARALVDLEGDAFEVFFRGARHVQAEPVWNGQVDAAAELRAYSAMGLARCGDRRAAEVLADLLADPEPAARSGAVRALAASGRVGTELLLRFKARLGDEEPAVLLDAFEALLALEPDSGLEPIADGLSSRDEIRFEAAAIALGSSHHPEAFPLLADAAEREGEWSHDRRKILFRAIGLVRGGDAAEHLVSLVSEAPEDTALLVLEALREVGTDHRIRDRLGEAVDARKHRELSRAFRGLSD